jgi:hypothetical protein
MGANFSAFCDWLSAIKLSAEPQIPSRPGLGRSAQRKLMADG